MSKQRTLEPVAGEPRETTQLPAIVPAEEREPPPPRALADMRQFGMMMPVEQMQTALAEYRERRDAFREWLLAQLISGTHYGFPPGTEPRSEVRNGVTWYHQKGRDGGTWYPETQWRPRPSLYDAGAQFIADLMGVRSEYEADLKAWEMSGKIPNRYFYRCTLYSRATGALLGEGVGACQASDESRNDKSSNAAIKKAKKSSLVSAVKDTYGLSDLFTQDAPTAPPEHENPEQKPGAPKARERLRRATKDELSGIFADWQTCHRGEGDEFRKWASEVVSESPAALKQSGTWTKEMIDACHAKLAKERGEPE